MEAPVDNHTDFMQHVWDLEKQNAALLDVVLFLDTAIEPQSRTYDEYGYCKIHQEILQDFQARIENALAQVKAE